MPDLPVDPLQRQAVTDLLVRYATGIDSRDWALLRSCFTDDCDADYGDIGHWRSGDDITTWMAETHEPLGPTHTSDLQRGPAPRWDVLRTRCAVQAVIVLPDRSAAVHAYGFYDDEIVFGRGPEDRPSSLHPGDERAALGDQLINRRTAACGFRGPPKEVSGRRPGRRARPAAGRGARRTPRRLRGVAGAGPPADRVRSDPRSAP